MVVSIAFVEVCLVGIALYIAFYFLGKKRDPRYPPGPPSLPIIGNLLQLGKKPQRVFIEWAHKYGDIFSFKMGSNDVIMLNDAKMIKDVFAEASSAGRTPNPIIKALASGNYGIIVGEGEHWEQQRRFTLRTLRFANLIGLESILNTSLTDEKWNLASLPIRFGGIGIRKLADLALPCFMSSVNSTFNLVQLMSNFTPDILEVAYYAEGLQLWNSLSEDPVTPPFPHIQKNWDNMICKRNVDNLTPTLNDHSSALLLASLRPESSAWLHVLPSRSIGTLMSNNEFRISISLRLGCTICKPHKCVCGQLVSSEGIHGLSCKKSAGRQSRHYMLNETIRRALVSANVPAILEPTGMTRDDGKRPDGMTIIPWQNGRCLVWDATCSDTLAPSYLKFSSKEAGTVANNAASRKRNKYQEISEDHIFMPFAVETLGPWSSDALNLVDTLGKKICAVTGDPRSKSY